jgi:hypothetical protein
MTEPRFERTFDIGRVVGNAFGAVGHNLASFAILAVVLAGIPGLIVGYGSFHMAQSALTGAAGPNLAAIGGALALIPVALLISIPASAIQQAAVIYGTAAYLNGRTASLGECLSAGLRRCLPLIGLTILMGIAIWFGLILFIVPGVMMAVAWIVSAPVLVVERTGVFGAFSRSAALTRGRRWVLFALGALFFIAVFIVQQVLLSVVRAVVASSDPTSLIVTQLPVSALSSIIIGVLSPAMVAAAYYELRAGREGIGPEALAAVFD